MTDKKYEGSRAERWPIGIATYRAEDLRSGDIAQLRLHGAARWVSICQDVARPEHELVSVNYTNSLGSYSSIDLGRYELVKVQYQRIPK